MGAIVSLPKSVSLASALQQLNASLTQQQRAQKGLRPANIILPAPQPAPPGEIVIASYPSENAEEPGNFMLAYPATLQLSATEDLLLGNFLSVFAGDATTNLYKLFVDSKTRIPGFEAQNVFAYPDDKQGQPIFIGLEGIKAENLTKEKAAMVRDLITRELNKIAAYKDRSPELLSFNKRYANALISIDRSFAKFVNSPPKFGFRSTFDSWYSQLQELYKIQGFKKSVTLKPQFDTVRALLASGTNIWKKYLPQWHLTTAVPYVAISKAEPSLIATAETEKKQRAAAEVAKLRALYNLTDDQQAILQYKALYDSNTVMLDKAEQANSVKFIENPPLTPDADLHYQQLKLAGGVSIVASVFDNMTSATTGIALDMHVVPQQQLVYLSLLPQLLTGTGIIKNNKPVSYEDMSQLLQQQILSLQSSYNTNGTTGRIELQVKGAGNNATEAVRAVQWMNDVLQHPYWQPENLPRIRDLVEQELANSRRTMQQPEEYWVNDPGYAYRLQSNPLLLATSSFLTKSFNIFRLKWMLKDAGKLPDQSAINKFFNALGNVKSSRSDLNKLLSGMIAPGVLNADSHGANKELANALLKLPAPANKLAKEAATDLQQMLNDIPDQSLAADWKFLCTTLLHDLLQSPQKTLADLTDVRTSLLNTGNARSFVIASASTGEKLKVALNSLLANFAATPVTKQTYTTSKLIDERIKERLHTSANPVFVGLINPNSPTGVFINSVPLVTYADTAKDKLLLLLAAELYGGGGKQSVYTKTTGAGLSYSTGVGANPISGRFSYYAERTPELPQTLRFVIDQVKNAPVDPNVVDYLVSLIVGYNRAASEYEARGEAMANDLADGFTPQVVSNFRQAVLRMRKVPNLVPEIYSNKDAVYEKILPGYGIKGKDVPGAIYFVIGPEKQMVAYENYLKAVEGSDTMLYRLYPRDFWMVPAPDLLAPQNSNTKFGVGTRKVLLPF